MEAALVACQFLQFLAVMAIFGASAMRLALGPHGAACDRRLHGAVVAAALAALVTAWLWLMLEAGGMAGSWADAIRPATIGAVLTGTGFGHVWLCRLVLAVLVCAAALAWARAWALLAVLSGLLLASLGLVGHAVAETGWLGAAHRLNQAMHLLAAGFWIGGLVLLLVLLSRRETPYPEAERALRRFSRFASAAVALIVGTGAVNALLLLGAWSDFVTTAYGAVLLAKLVLVAAMVLMALRHRFRLLPGIAAGRSGTLARFAGGVRAELGVGALVLLLSSLLGTLPPGGME